MQRNSEKVIKVYKRNKKKIVIRPYKDSIPLLKRLFAQYSFKDIAESIVSSELWIPNRSSGIKHKFIWGVLASMKVDEFSNKNQILKNSEFTAFLQTVYSLLPEFPMLEDFVPQADWGEIRVIFNSHILPVFYGGDIERITDFINAFEIRYSSHASILEDMENALTTQSLLLNAIDKSNAGSTKYISAGSLSIPTSKFWISIQKSIHIINKSQKVQQSAKKHSINLDEFTLPKSESAFGDAIMRGSLQQHLFISSDKRVYPTSLRNFASVVLDYWNNQSGLELNREEHVKAISKLINANIKSFIPGPNILYKQTTNSDLLYPSMFTSGENLFIPIPIEVEELEQADKTINEIIESFNQLDTIEFFNLNLKHIIRLSDQYSFSDNNIKILLILMDVSTESAFLESPKEPAYLISLPDFITLVSSYEEQDSIYDIINFGQSEFDFAPFTGIIDKLGAYKDSNSILVEGANSPNYMALVPNYGCEWRYKNLLKFWESAPKFFPVKNIGWELNTSYNGISSIVSKTTSHFSWFTQINKCELHFICNPKNQNLDVNDFRVLALSIECITDALKQRESIILNLPLFQRPLISVYCQADLNYPVSENKNSIYDNSIFTEWFLPREIHSEIRVKVSLNLKLISETLINATDASFQADCVAEFSAKLSDLLNLPCSSTLLEQIDRTSSRAPRVAMNVSDIPMSLPEIPNYDGATPKDFKQARKELAYILKSIKVAPGRYKLKEAKQIIDDAKHAYRNDIHQLLKRFDKFQLLTLCVEQHDRLFNKHYHKNERLKLSLHHEVNYDREREYSESIIDFTRDSKNYRYLIEYCVGMPNSGSIQPELEDVLNIFGKVDWLINLYSASDVLHNDIEVGGITVSDDYVPEIFYSNEKQKAETAFKKHDGSLRLGININHDDQIKITKKEQFGNLQKIFKIELGFSLSLMLEVLEHLSNWAFFTKKEPSYFYNASKQELITTIATSLEEDDTEAIAKVINFLILDSEKTRIINGKNSKEADVPIWEHYKRPFRYTVRPIISIGEKTLLWGAGNTFKSKEIWGNNIASGYLPFDMNSRSIDSAVRNIKKFLEKKLETIAYEVTSRFAIHCISGIDFKRRFPKKGFEDVGDYDVLAYWPEKNLWLTVECKYIQPPFSFKDTRRLRDKMFNSSKDKSHLCKIAKRRRFLTSNFDTVRTLLDWPNPATPGTEKIRELYVSKDTYWWMFATPYNVPTEFVQINLLENWFQKWMNDNNSK